MTDTRPGASSIIHNSNAALDAAHHYALQELAALENLIQQTKDKINAAKENAAEAVAAYVRSVDDAVQAARQVEKAVMVIENKIPGAAALPRNEAEV